MYTSSVNIKHQHSSRLHWGIHIPTGQPLWIDDVEQHGLACNCRCAACGEALEAHLGDVRRHHFKHYNNNECVYGNEIAEYMQATALLEEHKTLRLPSIDVVFGKCSHEICPAADTAITGVHFYYDPNHYPPLLIAETNQRPVRIVLAFDGYYNKADYTAFEEEAKRNGWDCLAVFRPDTAEGIPLTADTICSGTTSSHRWIYSSEAGSWIRHLEDTAIIPDVTFDVHGIGDAIWQIAEYECFLHLREFNGRYFAREEDCKNCRYNFSVSPQCQCLARAGIHRPEDLELPLEERMQEVLRIQKENEERIQQLHQKINQNPPAPKPQIYTNTGSVPNASKVVEDKHHIGYQDVKDCDPLSSRPVRDRFGTPWHYCIRCKQWVSQPRMASYGGAYGPVRGECKTCNTKRIEENRKRLGML